MAWTDEQRETAIRLGRDTSLSAAQIGAKVGKSRNAVIGLFHRNNVPLPLASMPRTKTRRIKRAQNKTWKKNGTAAHILARRARAAKHPDAEKRAEPVIKPDCAPIRFADLPLDRSRCCYPVSGKAGTNGPDMPVCGAPVADRKSKDGMLRSYCAFHVRVCSREPGGGA